MTAPVSNPGPLLSSMDDAAPRLAPPRTGRPPATRAGEVEERIVKAATRVFLERGFEGASLDEIAAAARAGKATLYSRYAGKEALFVAVIKEMAEHKFDMDQILSDNASVGERLTIAGIEMMNRMLNEEVLGLMRVVIAEAPRFPALATLTDQCGRQRAVQMLAGIIDGDPESRSGKAPNPSPATVEAAEIFLELVFPPIQFRALMGFSLAELRGEIPDRVALAVRLLTGAGLLPPAPGQASKGKPT